MKEELVTFETAKLAKSRGFKAPCRSFYPTVDVNGYEEGILNEYCGYGHYSFAEAPTQSLLQRWLREEHNILISIYSNASGYLWNMMYAIGGTDIGWSEYSGDDEASGTFTTYEKALEAGLQESLKLIKCYCGHTTYCDCGPEQEAKQS